MKIPHLQLLSHFSGFSGVFIGSGRYGGGGFLKCPYVLRHCRLVSVFSVSHNCPIVHPSSVGASVRPWPATASALNVLSLSRQWVVAVAADQRKWLNGADQRLLSSVTVSCPHLASWTLMNPIQGFGSPTSWQG